MEVKLHLKFWYLVNTKLTTIFSVPRPRKILEIMIIATLNIIIKNAGLT